MKKGFTLIELLAVVVLLSILALLVMPAVNNIIVSAKKKAYDANIEVIKNSAYDWALLNTSQLPSNQGGTVVVFLDSLKKQTNLEINVKNPMTGKVLSNNSTVTITKTATSYSYDVNLIEIGAANPSNAPKLTIPGDIIDYVNVGGTYTIPTPTPKTSNNTTITSGAFVTHQILKGNNEVSSIDTSKPGQYRLVYSVTYNNVTGVYEKTVVVRNG